MGGAVLGVAVVDIALAAEACIKSEALRGVDFPMQAAGDVFIAHAFHAGGIGIAGGGIDVGIIGIGFVGAAVNAE